MDEKSLFFVGGCVVGSVVYLGIAHWARFSKISRIALLLTLFAIPIVAVAAEYWILSLNYSFAPLFPLFFSATSPFLFVPIVSELSYRQCQQNNGLKNRIISSSYLLLSILVYGGIIFSMINIGISISQLPNGSSFTSFLSALSVFLLPITGGISISIAIILSFVWERILLKRKVSQQETLKINPNI